MTISEDTERWLKKITQRYRKLFENLPLFNGLQEPMAKFLDLMAKHPKVFCFESLFNEMFTHFDMPQYRAALALMEKVGKDDNELRRMIAVLAK